MVIVIDPYVAGISGDMILSSLVDLGANKNKILEGIRSCEKFLPGSIIKEIDFSKISKHGITCNELILDVDEKTHERKGSDIKQALKQSANQLDLSEKTKNFVESCIDTLISAESKIHGISEESVHFHEASSIDTLVDILGVGIAIDDLKLFDEEIVSMPICVGSGTITFSHGTMTNPASAVLEILKNSNLTLLGSKVKTELTTPTGACILVNLTNTSIEFYPSMKIDSVGYGAGKNNFDNFANVLKIVKGIKNKYESDSVIILETNVDDVSGEILGNLIEKIMLDGAKDASIFHGITKKGRPTNLVSIICDNNTIDKITDTLIMETGTLGIRVTSADRIIVPRTIHEIQITLADKTFNVKYKSSFFKGKSTFKIEFDDLKKIANYLEKSIKETESLVRKEIVLRDA
ncbi:MAG: nickel pincer cofactor biosynthesis protein LarC [Nitrosopumilus sp.]|nr:nickel pincer cofactor biosynthesis protein LarC [Nitrosopumilus sp.]MDH3824200.1 nickel pincer cofactor biosynthesis protein LarC [Nitrosopumilus sp.]